MHNVIMCWYNMSICVSIYHLPDVNVAGDTCVCVCEGKNNKRSRFETI